MPHSVAYPGNFDSLLKQWDDKVKQVWKESGQAGLDALKIANGECARLPQELTSVGHTSRWQPGEGVIDVARALRPGTVIANFVFEDGKWRYPNRSGWHAALYIKADSFSVATGKPHRIWMFDQWTHPESPKWPSPRPVRVWPAAIAKNKRPADKAEDFFVVMVP